MEELTLSFSFECDICKNNRKGEPVNKFVMAEDRQSELMRCCSQCAKMVDEHNDKFLKPIQEKEEAEREERRQKREAEEAKQRAEAEAAAAKETSLYEQNQELLAAITQQNSQIIALLAHLVQKDDKPKRTRTRARE